MKSEKAKQRLYESFTFNSNIGIDRKAAIEAVDLAEQDAEERMKSKAFRIIKEMMEAVFKGDMPRKIADEFIQKLTENEND